MSNRGGKPSHCFNEFVHIKKDVKINQSNYLAVCRGCITVKGWTWAETEARKINMFNTVPSIGKHLSVCENFKTTYPDKVEHVKENVEARKQRTAELRTANNLKKQYQRSERTVYLIYYSYFYIFIFYIFIYLFFITMVLNITFDLL